MNICENRKTFLEAQFVMIEYYFINIVFSALQPHWAASTHAPQKHSKSNMPATLPTPPCKRAVHPGLKKSAYLPTPPCLAPMWGHFTPTLEHPIMYARNPAHAVGSPSHLPPNKHARQHHARQDLGAQSADRRPAMPDWPPRLSPRHVLRGGHVQAHYGGQVRTSSCPPGSRAGAGCAHAASLLPPPTAEMPPPPPWLR